MPPKRKVSQLNKTVQSGPVSTGSILKMFKKIESTDLKYKECAFCQEKVKSCLYKDHVDTKCLKRYETSMKNEPYVVKCENFNEINNDDDEVIFVTELNTSNGSTKSFASSKTLTSCVSCRQNQLVSIKQEIKEDLKEDLKELLKTESLIKVESCSSQTVSVQISSEIETSNNNRVISSPFDSNESNSVFVGKESEKWEETENEDKERRMSLKRPLPLEDNQIGANSNADSSKLSEDEVLLNDYMDKLETSLEQTKPSIEYYLINFTNAIESVLNEPSYSFLLSEYDSHIVEKFSQLTRRLFFSKIVRLSLVD
jgi:hypothetical protein